MKFNSISVLKLALTSLRSKADYLNEGRMHSSFLGRMYPEAIMKDIADSNVLNKIAIGELDPSDPQDFSIINNLLGKSLSALLSIGMYDETHDYSVLSPENEDDDPRVYLGKLLSSATALAESASKSSESWKQISDNGDPDVTNPFNYSIVKSIIGDLEKAFGFHRANNKMNRISFTTGTILSMVHAISYLLSSSFVLNISIRYPSGYSDFYDEAKVDAMNDKILSFVSGIKSDHFDDKTKALFYFMTETFSVMNGFVTFYYGSGVNDKIATVAQKLGDAFKDKKITEDERSEMLDSEGESADCVHLRDELRSLRDIVESIYDPSKIDDSILSRQITIAEFSYFLNWTNNDGLIPYGGFESEAAHLKTMKKDQQKLYFEFQQMNIRSLIDDEKMSDKNTKKVEWLIGIIEINRHYIRLVNGNNDTVKEARKNLILAEGLLTALYLAWENISLETLYRTKTADRLFRVKPTVKDDVVLFQRKLVFMIGAMLLHELDFSDRIDGDTPIHILNVLKMHDPSDALKRDEFRRKFLDMIGIDIDDANMTKTQEFREIWSKEDVSALMGVYLSNSDILLIDDTFNALPEVASTIDTSKVDSITGIPIVDVVVSNYDRLKKDELLFDVIIPVLVDSFTKLIEEYSVFYKEEGTSRNKFVHSMRNYTLLMGRQLESSRKERW